MINQTNPHQYAKVQVLETDRSLDLAYPAQLPFNANYAVSHHPQSIQMAQQYHNNILTPNHYQQQILMRPHIQPQFQQQVVSQQPRMIAGYPSTKIHPQEKSPKLVTCLYCNDHVTTKVTWKIKWAQVLLALMASPILAIILLLFKCSIKYQHNCPTCNSILSESEPWFCRSTKPTEQEIQLGRYI